jgi:integrase
MTDDIITIEDNKIEVFKKQNLTKTIRKVNTTKWLVYEEAKNIINKIPNNRDRMFLMFLLMTGLRVTEAIRIKKEDVFLDNSTIKVDWLKKRKKQQRTIIINDSLKQVLSFYIANLKYNDKLFPFTRQNADNIAKKWFGEDVSCHTFRHTFAMHYLVSDGRVTDLKELMGHNNVNVTLIYVKLLGADLKKEVNNIKW